jgi:hypothetical protein
MEIVALSIVFILCVSVCKAGPLPDTGQTRDYSSTFGEDSDYTINPPSYTKLDDNGNALPVSATEWVMVRDNVTGLVWEVKTDDDSIHDKDNLYTWYDSNPQTNGGHAGTPGPGTDAEDFINNLNANDFGGFSDWRLPTVKELRCILNRGSYPVINTEFFPQTIASLASFYWSSTTEVGDNTRAWEVYFYTGALGQSYKSISRYVRAVRGRKEQALGHLVVNGDGTVTDTSTGLMWQQATADSFQWHEALTYCENLSFAGYDDWRLPNANELQSLVDYGKEFPAINTKAFPDTPNTEASYYWTSTHSLYYTNTAYYVWFGKGVTDHDRIVGYGSPARAVRGGQKWALGHLVISSPDQASSWDVGNLMPITWDTQNISGNVRISISRQGGKNGTFETIAESTKNDGIYEWQVTEPGSVNCMLKIEPLDDQSKGNIQGLFSIRTLSGSMPWIPLLLLDD